MDAKEFFEQCDGQWVSQRTTHHLAFRRSETGDSYIQVKSLPAEDPKVKELCEFHQVDPTLAMSGALVSWDGSMAWDKEGEKHSGSTVMVLVPDDETQRYGRLLRERGYVESAPVVGRFEMDGDNGLVLSTDYETMTAYERFWFPTPGVRVRTSTVKWFGGFSTATFCTETRIEGDHTTRQDAVTPPPVSMYSIMGG